MSSSPSSPSRPTPHLEPLLTIQQLSDYLGVPVKTLYDWRSQGLGPQAIKIGRALRYPASRVAAWIAERS